MNKKATQSLLKDIIIVSIIGIIFFVFITNLGAEIRKLENREICKLSVQKKQSLKLFKLGAESDSPLECYPNNIEITKKGIYLSNEKQDKELDISFKGNTKEKSEDQIKKYLANQLYDCWYQYGEGKIDFLSEWGIDIDVRCFPCANIHFKEPFLEDIKFIDWYEYLSSHNPPLSDISYYKYLGYGNTDFKTNQHKDKKIDPDKKGFMTIQFVAFKQIPNIFVAGYRPDLVSIADLTNPDNVAKQCEQFY